MKLVRATSASKSRKMRIKELNRIANEGEEFVVSDERYQILSGKNYLAIPFVTFIKDIPEDLPTSVSLKTDFSTVPTEEPEIFVIEPGKEPVRVNEKLEPITSETEVKKTSRQKRKKVEDVSGEEVKKKPRRKKATSEATE